MLSKDTVHKKGTTGPFSTNQIVNILWIDPQHVSGVESQTPRYTHIRRKHKPHNLNKEIRSYAEGKVYNPGF